MFFLCGKKTCRRWFFHTTSSNTPRFITTLGTETPLRPLWNVSKFEPVPSRRRLVLRDTPPVFTLQDIQPRIESPFVQQELLTKIVCTIGPSTLDATVLASMMKQGMTVARLNFSHGTHEEHRKRFELVRSVSEELKRPVAIMCDIQGPKIRLGELAQETIQLSANDVIRVTPHDIVGTKDRLTVRLPSLLKDLHKGDQIFINDGIIELRVEHIEPDDVVCRVQTGGFISARKGCNLPSTRIHVDIMTEKDRRDLKLIAELNPEFVAASFVGSAADIALIRKTLYEYGNSDIQIIAKIERPLALKNMDEIITASDAVMVARGDLGVEIPAYQVPVAQKQIVRQCNIRSRPVIIATQMLESMTLHPRPTRAEASDVFNAVVDGADAVMLSGETSVGHYPVDTVRCMAQIAQAAQAFIPPRDPEAYRFDDGELHESMGRSLSTLAQDIQRMQMHGKIVVLTESGFAARMMSKFRPNMPICAVVTSERVARELCLVWGISTVHHPRLTTLFHKRKYETLIKQLCYQKVVGQHEVVLLVQTFGHHATLSVYNVDEIMHDSIPINVDHAKE